MHRTKADRRRLQIKRREERRRMLDNEMTYRVEFINTAR